MSKASIGPKFKELEEKLEGGGGGEVEAPRAPDCIPIPQRFELLEKEIEGEEIDYGEHTACEGTTVCEACPAGTEPVREFEVEITWPEIFQEEERPKTQDTPEQEIELSETKIYLMDTQEYTKIGISKDPEKRLQTIQSHTPQEVTLVTTIESDYPEKVERLLHQTLEEHQTSTGREWFKLPPKIWCELEDVDILTQEKAYEWVSYDSEKL